MRLLLLMGYLAVTLGVVTAAASPAEGYELSIYASTPTTFWVFLGAALIITILTVLASSGVLERRAGAFLGGTVVQTVALLPIIRGYYYLGGGDALRHLGRAIDISNGTTGLLDHIYFGLHVLGLFITETTSLRLEWGLMMGSMVFVGLFLSFGYLGITRLVPDPRISAIALFSVMLLLPLNQVSRAGVFLQPYPTTVALFFFPVVLFCIIAYSTKKWFEWSLLLMITTLTILFFHPQQAANLLILLSVIVLLQLYIQLAGFNLVSSKPLYYPTAIFGIIFWLWVSSHRRFERGFSGFIASMLTDPQTTGDVESVGHSLDTVGASLEELFVKLFLVSLLYCLLTGGLMIFYGWKLANSSDRYAVVRDHKLQIYFGVGLIPIVCLFIAYSVFSSQYFRHLGFIMVIATILGAVALHSAVDKIGYNRSTKWLLGVGFVLVLGLAITTMHFSPFIYLPNAHVSEGTMAGYEATFEFTEPSENLFIGIRATPPRAAEAIYGQSYNINSDTAPDNFAGQNLPDEFNDSFYLIVTTKDLLRDVVLYEESRYSEDNYSYLNKEPKLTKVYSNGEFDLYYHYSPNESGECCLNASKQSLSV
jgi:hypothetical protein